MIFRFLMELNAFNLRENQESTNGEFFLHVCRYKNANHCINHSMSLNKATIIFKGSLQDFTGQARVVKSFQLHPSAKDLIESCGVPQVEVYGLKVDNRLESFSYNVADADKLTVYPKRNPDGEDNPYNIREARDLPSEFIADVHLGKLTRYLRLLGFDTVYKNDAKDTDIIDAALRHNRTVLTRDIGLLKHGRLKHGYWLRSTDPNEQVLEVITYFELADDMHPFTLCMNCNGYLEPVAKEGVSSKLPPKIKKNFEEFRQCQACGQVYWKGSHYQKLIEKVRQIKNVID